MRLKIFISWNSLSTIEFIFGLFFTEAEIREIAPIAVVMLPEALASVGLVQHLNG